MKKLLTWAMTAALICGTTVFTACTSSNDNPVTPNLNLSEKIIGKWITSLGMAGQPALTDDKEVITFVSSTKAYASRSRGAEGGEYQPTQSQNQPESGADQGGAGWDDYVECEVKIDGNTVSLISDGPDGSKNTLKLIVKSISDTAFECQIEREAPGGQSDAAPSNPAPGAEMPEGGNAGNMQNQVFVKLTADYSETILGLWECQELTGIETFNDANARLEFFADGTYKYWRKSDAGEWEAVNTRDFQNYFADGTLLCTRWKNQGEAELREWWEIASIANGQMQWTALRKKDDGTTVQQGAKWTKVQ